MADNTPARPWYVDLTKEIGGLGLVLIMLVGIYLLADKYFAKMEKTWDDIHSVTVSSVEKDRESQENLRAIITKFIAEQEARMTEHSARMTKIEARINQLYEPRRDP